MTTKFQWTVPEQQAGMNPTPLRRVLWRPTGVLPLCAVLVAGCLAGCNDDKNASPDSGDKDSGTGGEHPQKDAGTKPPPKDGGGVKPPHDGGPKDAGPDHDGDVVEPHDSGIDSGIDASDPEPDADVPDADVLDGDVADAEPPLTLGGLTVDTDREAQDLDLFGVPGHHFWIEVDDTQLEAMNANRGGYYGGGGGNPYGDIYTPGGSNATYSEHVLVENAADDSVADYGKMEVKLVGESTGREWSKQTIPNVRIDTDEFEMGKRIGGFEHFRFNNGQVSSIFPELIAHRIYNELDYPALRASFAFLGSNVWGNDVWVPMTLIEVYKTKFCDDNAELIGGTCNNMWELVGDIAGYYGGGIYGGGVDLMGGVPVPVDGPLVDPGIAPPMGAGGGIGGAANVPADWCQLHECDNTEMAELIDTLSSTPAGPGFKAALEPYVVWERWHQFQCLQWILWIGDDPIHNGGNNTMMIERDDGKFMWEPYSADISAGMSTFGYTNIPLTGDGIAMSRGCQRDPACWADTIAACEDLIVRFDQLNPEEIVDQTIDTLTDLGMMRNGDEARAEQIRDWYVTRQMNLPTELERYRYLPDENYQCPENMELCGDGGCGTPEACETRNCSYDQVFCSSLDRCIYTYDEGCPECPEETPLYCSQNSECVADVQACHDVCAANNPGYEWCDYYQSCEPIEGCPTGGDNDGGVIDQSQCVNNALNQGAAFGEECLQCTCNGDAQALSACDGECWALINCAAAYCAPGDIACIQNNCGPWLGAAGPAQQVAPLLQSCEACGRGGMAMGGGPL